ncbi:hypothetical protein SYNPS1DRAFT_29875 [Syncephalis pseudoplumigaleata]|uniref:Uncharacterized protein n=1 Tax=Syncephalis pseudoplumigaleata TaxID=1712513 RepID=A0A4P9YWC0_9FUNG|nr:hypothetical protein SYNPS1DRAFT_29875 [Syncephalis pseudoplumigaleata]|eukprot:RKP24356.1 hypothetical protein SYNPS1DRAFT_29875 [Syncephalis pseudoplumigaleata]
MIHRTAALFACRACQQRLLSTAIANSEEAAPESDEQEKRDTAAVAHGYIERRRQRNRWYNYYKEPPQTIGRQSTLLKVASELSPSTSRGIEHGHDGLGEFDRVVNSVRGVDDHQLEIPSGDEDMEIVMLRDALVNNNLDSAWALFTSINGKGLLRRIPPSLLSRLLVTIRHTCQHRIEMALANEQGRITNRIHLNDYLYALFEAMHQHDGQFSRPRDYAFWMLWLLQQPRTRTKAQLTARRISTAKMALNVYLKAEAQQLEEDARLMVAVSLAIWYLSQEKASKMAWMRKITLAAHNLAKLLAIGADWMSPLLARDLFIAAHRSLEHTSQELPAPALSTATLQKLKIAHTHRLQTYDRAIVELIGLPGSNVLIASEVYEMMRKDGFYPPPNTWANFVIACARRWKFRMALRLWNDRREAGLPCSFRAGRELIRQLAHRNYHNNALLIYQDICAHSGRGHAVWPAHATIIPILLQKGQLTEVDRILDTWSLDYNRRRATRRQVASHDDDDDDEEEEEDGAFPSFFDASVDHAAEPAELAKWHGMLIDAYARRGQHEDAERIAWKQDTQQSKHSIDQALCRQVKHLVFAIKLQPQRVMRAS